MRRRRGRWLMWAGLVLLAGTIALVASAHALGPGMIVGASAPDYRPTTPPPDVSAVVEVERAGARVRAWMLDPAGEPRGTLLLLHGIHDSKRSLLSTGRRHAARGFRVLLIDARGHGESSGRWLTYGVEEARDLVALVDSLESSRRLVRPLVVVGTSYGAATAIQYAALDPRVSATVALAPFASLREVVPAYVEWTLGPAGRLMPAWQLTQLVDDAGRWGGFDPDAACPRCVAPAVTGALLLVHGREDERIPWRHSVRIRDAATDRAELVIVPGADHLGIGSAPGVSERIDRWLSRHAPP